MMAVRHAQGRTAQVALSEAGLARPTRGGQCAKPLIDGEADGEMVRTECMRRSIAWCFAISSMCVEQAGTLTIF